MKLRQPQDVAGITPPGPYGRALSGSQFDERGGTGGAQAQVSQGRGRGAYCACTDPTPFASFLFAMSKRSAHMYPACPVGDCRSTPAALMRSAHPVLNRTSARLD